MIFRLRQALRAASALQICCQHDPRRGPSSLELLTSHLELLTSHIVQQLPRPHRIPCLAQRDVKKRFRFAKPVSRVQGLARCRAAKEGEMDDPKNTTGVTDQPSTGIREKLRFDRFDVVFRASKSSISNRLQAVGVLAHRCGSSQSGTKNTPINNSERCGCARSASEADHRSRRQSC
jgi:hypothetical protein